MQTWLVTVTERETGLVLDTFTVLGTRYEVYEDLWLSYRDYEETMKVSVVEWS